MEYQTYLPKQDNNFHILTLKDKTKTFFIAINSHYLMYCGIQNPKD